MEKAETLIPHLFRTEFSKIVSVLAKRFGLGQVGLAEDVASEAFLLATETWESQGVPAQPRAWLYQVARNKALDTLRREQVFREKLSPALQAGAAEFERMEIDWSEGNIQDSQLRMIFALCHPVLPIPAQIGLALRILCGLGIEEIADAFLSSKSTINKRLFRAKEKLRQAGISLDFPGVDALTERLDSVLLTLYLLFNEGYYSQSQNTVLRKDLCREAMRLCLLLLDHPPTCRPPVQALLALMCFHTSRFTARQSAKGDLILYEDQDRSLWDRDLILQGEYFLHQSATGEQGSRYHLEAAIAFWHTREEDGPDKWEKILQLYNSLLQVAYSPVAALNRTYALFRSGEEAKAIQEAEKLGLEHFHLYHALLGEMYRNSDPKRAEKAMDRAIQLARTDREKAQLKIRKDKIASQTD